MDPRKPDGPASLSCSALRALWEAGREYNALVIEVAGAIAIAEAGRPARIEARHVAEALRQIVTLAPGQGGLDRESRAVYAEACRRVGDDTLPEPACARTP